MIKTSKKISAYIYVFYVFPFLTVMLLSTGLFLSYIFFNSSVLSEFIILISIVALLILIKANLWMIIRYRRSIHAWDFRSH